MAMNVYKNIESLTKKTNLTASIHTNPEWEKITKTRFVDYRTNYIVTRVDENENLYGFCSTRGVDFSEYDAVVISDYNKGFLSEAEIEQISRKATITFLDTKKVLGDWCKHITYIKINDVEYAKTEHMLTNEMIQKMIITLGPDGCKYQDIVYSVPQVEIKDAAGAGDTFIAALAVEYVKTKNVQKAIKFANKCATKVVQKKGVSIA
jgi:sugar/nucleoside kinase (ribokinase family)